MTKEEKRKKHAERQKAYYHKNHAKMREQAKARYYKNRDHFLKACKEYRERNLSKCQERSRKYYQSHKEQNRKNSIAWIEKNREKFNENARRRYREMSPEKKAILKEKQKSWSKKYASKNKGKIRETKRRWAEKNREKLRARNAETRKNFPHRHREARQKRRAALKFGRKDGHNPKIIKVLFEQASRLHSELGIRFSVDHIVPLTKGGLHHQKNLQVMPSRLNRMKKNRTLECPIWADPNFTLTKAA